MNADVKGQTVRSARFALMGTGAAGLLQVITLVLLSRFLTPVDYGLIAAAMVLTKPIQLVVYSGIERAIVMEGSVSAEQVAAFRGFAILAGAISTGALIAVAAVSWFLMDKAPFGRVLMALAPTQIVALWGLSSRAMLRREMKYGRIAVIDLAAQVLGLTGVSFALAAFGFGPFSLAAGYLAQAALQGALLSLSLRIGGAYSFRFGVIRETLVRAFNISKVTGLEVIHGQTAPAFVGALLGTASLGLFNRAYTVIQLPAEMIASTLTRVFLSGFTAVRTDTGKLGSACKSLVQIGATATLPLCFGMVGARIEVVDAALGQRWVAAAAVIPGIAIGTACYVVAYLFGVLNEAAGRFTAKFWIQLATTGLVAICFLTFGRLGLAASGAIYGIGGVAFLIGQIWLSSRVLELKMLTLSRWILPGALCGVALLAYTDAVHRMLPWPGLQKLVVEVIGCGLIAPTVYLLFFPAVAAEIIQHSGVSPARLLSILRRRAP